MFTSPRLCSHSLSANHAILSLPHWLASARRVLSCRMVPLLFSNQDPDLCLPLSRPQNSSLCRFPRLIVGLALLLSWSSRPCGAAQSGDFQYSGSGGLATITGYTGAGGSVDVPLTIGAYRVAYIGGYAFAYANSVTNINLPGGLISFEPSAFFLCPNLTAINVDRVNSGLCSVDGVVFNKSRLTLLQYPPAKTGSYSVPAGVTTLNTGAFLNCNRLTRIIVPASVTSIGNQAFDYCSAMSSFLFLGNAPTVYTSGFASSSATVYYVAGASGWGSSYAGRPTMLWNPAVQTLDASFGVGATGFGFAISGNSNLVVVVEATADPANGDWSPVATNALSGSNWYFSDLQWTNYAARFYRLMTP